MARNDRAMNKINKNMQSIAQGISSNMDALYRSTYMSTPQQSKDLETLGDRINQSIDNIVNNNMNTIGEPSISKLYTRLSSANPDSRSIAYDLGKIFDTGLMTDDLYDMFMSNRYLRELDTEIDTVCKYMPSLDEALDVQKDCVLSADHFSKDFINVEYPGYNIDKSVFSERIKDIKKKYNIPVLAEEIYDDTAKYGERFVYKIPYKTAIGRLLATKADTSLLSPYYKESSADNTSVNEFYLLDMDNKFITIRDTNGSSYLNESAVIVESSVDRANRTFKEASRSILGEKDHFSIAIEICKSNVIESVVESYKEATGKKGKYSKTSMASLYEDTHQSSDKKNIAAKGNIDWGKNNIDNRIIMANDGLIDGSNPEPVKVNTYGCVIKKLERDHVIPIYIEDICMGYYYFEIRTLDKSDTSVNIKNLFGDPLMNMKGNDMAGFNASDATRQDEAIRFVAGQLSRFIDKKFVNNNQDLAKEIYMILKCNELLNSSSIDMIKITFIPPEDMIHFYFKFDRNSHRGISDLAKSLIPAKIYSTLYITDAIGHMTRGQDKRVYYVKQTVDTNIAQTLLNTINQIKQGNFGIRNFSSINNILNIVGKFNDYVIPTNASGESPIQFEVMPGQDIKTPTELMEDLERMAINATGIPYEIIQTRQSVDYAIQFTMSSSKIMRWTYKRQELFENLLSTLITSIYNYEYDESVELKVVLPPPSFINVTNTNQMVDNTKTFVQSIVEVEMANEPDEKLKNMYTSELFNYYLGTHIDTAVHKNILDRCRVAIKADNNETHSDDAGQSEY